MKQPEVSILIPVYNRENFIGECIQSALDQTFTDFEVVIVDNASTDRTWEICQEYAVRDERIRIFRNANNVGPVRNWLACLNHANGICGKILFSDDLIHAEYIKKTLPYLQSDDVGFVFSCAMIGSEEWIGIETHRMGNTSGKYTSSDFIEAALFTSKAPVSPGAALFRINDLRKNLILDLPSPSFDDFPDHGAGPDLLLYLLTARDYRKVAYVDEALVFFRSHAGSITERNRDMVESRYLQAKVWFLNEYGMAKLLGKLLLYEWIKARLLKKHKISYQNFCGKFLFRSMGCSLASMSSTLVLLLKKILYRGLHG